MKASPFKDIKSFFSPKAAAAGAEAGAGGTVKVLRVGYSIVEGQTWIRPHYGSTNAQLKMHVGLTVPSDSRSRSRSTADSARKIFCPPAIRVGRVPGDGAIRRWSRGTVLLFDDSFEHEVKNDCDKARAVFQVVFERPDAAQKADL